MDETESEDAFKQVCEAVRKEEVVFWAGAGFSAYAGYPAGKVFARMLAGELGENPPDEELILPNWAERYEEAKGRGALLARIGEVCGKEPSSIEAHRLLSRIKGIPYIVTTNYDRLFEIAFGDAIISIASEQELPKAKGRGRGDRKTILYKIHGDVDHLDETVITRKDYDRFDETKNKGVESLLWTKIRTIPAEYPIIFIGYSLDDPNTRAVLDRILERLGPRETPYYIITRHKPTKDLEWYKKHNVKWIEKDAVEAIKEINNHVTRYSFLDSSSDIVRMALIRPLLEDRNLDFPFEVGQRQKIRKLSVRRIDPEAPFEFSSTLHLSAAGNSPHIRALDDLLHGKIFDPVEVCGQDSKAKMNMDANGVLLTDPDGPYLDSLIVTPNPFDETDVDLRIGTDPVQIISARLKRFISETNGRLLFTTPIFTLTIDIEKASLSGPLKLSINPIEDIEKGREIYSFFNAWVKGESIFVVFPGALEPLLLPSRVIQEDLEGSEKIRFWYEIFRDLSDIQRACRVRLELPNDGITGDEIQVIADAAELIRGERRIQGEIKMHLLAQVPDAAKVLTDEPVDVECSHPDCVESFEIFGCPISLPVIIGGRGVVPSNLDEALAEAATGAEKVTVIYDGSVGELYQRYIPSSDQNGDREMTTP